MKARTWLVGAAAALGLEGASSAQRPDLSGTWAATTEAPAGLAAAPSAVLGPRLGIAVTDGRFTLTRPVRDDVVTSVFATDGTPTVTRIPGRLCEGEGALTETATWEGQALVFAATGLAPAGGGPVRGGATKRLLRLQAPDVLVVEGTIVQQGQARTVGTVYRRTADALPAPKPGLPTAGVPASIAEVAWIAGTWQGPSGTAAVEERWSDPASGGMIGVARTVRGGALVNFEFLCLSERAGTVAYVAMPDARMPPTFFVLTKVGPGSATFENPAHDFPQVVRYLQRPDGTLETTVSGAGGARAQTVVLKRQ
jgi:hypothetical protein